MKSTIEIVSETISVKHSFKKCPWLFLEMNKPTKEKEDILAREEQCIFPPCNVRGQPVNYHSSSSGPGSTSWLPCQWPPSCLARQSLPKKATSSQQNQKGHLGSMTLGKGEGVTESDEGFYERWCWSPHWSMRDVFQCELRSSFSSLPPHCPREVYLSTSFLHSFSHYLLL